MAKQRMIDTRFWVDGWVKRLTPTERYLFLYLMTNDKCSFCGIYELPLAVISFETGLSEQELQDLLSRLEPKVIYHNEWIYLANFKRYHVSEKSINSTKGYMAALDEVPIHVRAFFDSWRPLQAPPSPSDTITSASTFTITSASRERSASEEARDENTGIRTIGEIIKQRTL